MSIDNFNELEMANKRNHKVMITDIAISKVPYIKYAEIPEKESAIIQELGRQVLRLSKEENDSNEVAITYCMDHDGIDEDEDFVGVAFGWEHDVDPLSDALSFHLIMSKSKCVIISLHNHPSLSNISLADIRFFLEHDSIKLMVIVTNLGNIFYMVKSVKYSRYDAVKLYNDSVNLHNKASDLKGFQKAADFFARNSHKVGIIYDNH